jgi:hypothetical protein
MLSPLHAAAMRRHARALRRGGQFELDVEQVPGLRDGVCGEAMCLVWLRQLAPLVTAIVGEPVRPSYTWLRRYRPGAVLERHVDRDHCRWNVSLCVDMEPDRGVVDAWPLNMTLRRETHSVRLGIGDAVLFSGTKTPHWRDVLTDGAVSMCFFHFVSAKMDTPGSYLG